MHQVDIMKPLADIESTVAIPDEAWILAIPMPSSTPDVQPAFNGY